MIVSYSSPVDRTAKQSLTLPVDYTVVRGRRKTMAVLVRHETVEVRVPLFVSQAQIQDFVSSHAPWILRKLAHKAEQDAQRPDLREGGSLYYKARNLRVRFVSAVAEHVDVTAEEIRIHGRALTPERAARVLQRWLLALARECLPARTRALAEHLQLGARLKEVVFRKTRSKWGHCTSGGRIQFNWLIMLAPDAVIDYMICHEVCHLRHMNHSPQYWALVESVCPDHRRYVRWLRTHEHRLWL
jgi:predicted metal-dependent hydrolase